ncbi:MAG: hypothetical protein H7281_18195 [Bacteriovorax sp.]|nr:hypothetical protein [Bacteriovorax sp.]
MNIQLIKMNQGRKRFLKTQPILDINNWQAYLAELKSFLSLESGFQIVGGKVYFEMSVESEAPKMMLEVIGLPIPLEQNALVLADLDCGEVLVHKLTGLDLFCLDFDQLFKTSWGLKWTLEASFRKQADELSAIFHIVFDHDKIELHFFRQKDYIQKQF